MSPTPSLVARLRRDAVTLSANGEYAQAQNALEAADALQHAGETRSTCGCETKLSDDVLYAATDEIIEWDGGYTCANRNHETMSALRAVLMAALHAPAPPSGS